MALSDKQQLRIYLISAVQFTQPRDAERFSRWVVKTLSDEELKYLLDIYKSRGI